MMKVLTRISTLEKGKVKEALQLILLYFVLYFDSIWNFDAEQWKDLHLRPDRVGKTVFRKLRRYSQCCQQPPVFLPSRSVIHKVDAYSYNRVCCIYILIFNTSVRPDMTLEKGHLEMKKDRPVLSLGKAGSTTNPMKKSQKTKPLEVEKTIGGKDASLFLFRALGKILHCKRKSYFPIFIPLPLFPCCLSVMERPSESFDFVCFLQTDIVIIWGWVILNLQRNVNSENF